LIVEETLSEGEPVVRLVPTHEVERVVGFDRRWDGHHPIIRRAVCPMSGERIETAA
jgi:hypothetical protein